MRSPPISDPLTQQALHDAFYENLLTRSLTKVVRYLGWLSINAKTFNVGQYRRNDNPNPSAAFFDTNNPEGERLRRAAADAAINDMVRWFNKGEGTVAILDATNSTKDRRRWIQGRCVAANIETLFVESKCDDEELVMSNIMDVKTSSADYSGQNPEDAARDFRERIKNYEKVYQTIDEDEADMTYVKLINVGSQVIINRIQDYLQSRVVYYLMNLHIKPRSIWISRVSRAKPTPISSSKPLPLRPTSTKNLLFPHPARRVLLQPDRSYRGRRLALPARPSLRPRPPLPGPPLRRPPPQTHRLDLDP